MAKGCRKNGTDSANGLRAGGSVRRCGAAGTKSAVGQWRAASCWGGLGVQPPPCAVGVGTLPVDGLVQAARAAEARLDRKITGPLQLAGCAPPQDPQTPMMTESSRTAGVLAPPCSCFWGWYERYQWVGHRHPRGTPPIENRHKRRTSVRIPLASGTDDVYILRPTRDVSSDSFS